MFILTDNTVVQVLHTCCWKMIKVPEDSLFNVPCVFRCLDYLLDNGADPTLKNCRGYSAVHYAAAYGNKQHLELVSCVFCFVFLSVNFFC